MSDFDPYLKWLGIPPEDQPPSHYRLLGVPLYDDDPDVINNAADQRMGFLRTFANGKNGAASQKLLNEVSAARVCLLDPLRKAAYDAQLAVPPEASIAKAVAVATVPPTVSPPVTSPLAPAVRAVDQDEGETESTSFVRRSPSRGKNYRRRQKSLLLPIVGIIVLLGIAAAVVFALSGQRDDAMTLDSSPEDVEPMEEDASAADSSFEEAPRVEEDDATEEPPENVEARDIAGDDQPADVRPPADSDVDGGGKPPELARAQAALGGRDVAEAIEQLENYLAGDPQPPFEDAARDLLEQAQFVSSDEQVRRFIVQQLSVLSDEEVQNIARGSGPVPLKMNNRVKHPTLRQIFVDTAKRNLSQAVRERLDGGPNDSELTPAELLDRRGLIREQDQWRLKGETRLRDQISRIEKLEAELVKARRTAEGSKLQRLEKRKAELVNFTSIADKRLAALKRSSAPAAVVRRFEMAAKDAQSKLAQVEAEIRALKSAGAMIEGQLFAETQRADDAISKLEEQYEELRQDAAVQTAIDSAGGKLGPTIFFSAARLKVATVQRRIANDAQ